MKEITQIDLIKKTRRKWTINPCCKIVPSKKVYNRKKPVKGDKDENESGRNSAD